MRYCSIAFAVLLAASASLQAQDQPAPPPPPAAPPASTDAVKGTAAEQAVTIYQKAIEQADEDFQKKVKTLQQEYMRKVESPYKNYVTALRTAQAAETKKGNLEAALAVKKLADAVEASGPPLATAVEGAKREPPPLPKANSGAFVGRWVDSHGHDFILSDDGTSRDYGGATGRWAANKEGTVVEERMDRDGCVNVFKQIDGKKWAFFCYHNGRFDSVQGITQP